MKRLLDLGATMRVNALSAHTTARLRWIDKAEYGSCKSDCTGKVDLHSGSDTCSGVRTRVRPQDGTAITVQGSKCITSRYPTQRATTSFLRRRPSGTSIQSIRLLQDFCKTAVGVGDSNITPVRESVPSVRYGSLSTVYVLVRMDFRKGIPGQQGCRGYKNPRSFQPGIQKGSKKREWRKGRRYLAKRTIIQMGLVQH